MTFRLSDEADCTPSRLAVMAFFRPSWAGRASMRVPLANVAVETDAVLALTVDSVLCTALPVTPIRLTARC